MTKQQQPHAIVHYLPSQQSKVEAAAAAESDIATNSKIRENGMNNNTSRRISTARKADRRHVGVHNTSGSFLLMPTRKETNRTALSSNGKTSVSTSSDSSRRKSSSRFNKKDLSILSAAGASSANPTARSCSYASHNTNYTEDSGDTYFQITYHPGVYQPASTRGEGSGAGTAIVVSPSPSRSTRSSGYKNYSMGHAQPRLGHHHDLTDPFEDMNIVQILPDVVDDGDDEEDTLDGSIEVSYKKASKYADGTSDDVAFCPDDDDDTLDDSIEMSIRDQSAMGGMYGIFRREEATTSEFIVDIPKASRSKSKIVMVPKIASTSNNIATHKPNPAPFKIKEQGVEADSTGTKQSSLHSSHPSSAIDAGLDSSGDINSACDRGNVGVEMELEGHTSPLTSPQNEKFISGYNPTSEKQKSFSHLRPTDSFKRAFKSMTKLMDVRRYHGRKTKVLSQNMEFLVEADDDGTTVEVLTDGSRRDKTRQDSKKSRMEKVNLIGDGKRYFSINHGKFDVVDGSSSTQTHSPSESGSEKYDSTTNSFLSNLRASDGSSAFRVVRSTSSVESFDERESKVNPVQRFGLNQYAKDGLEARDLSTKPGGKSKIVSFSEGTVIAEATTVDTKATTKNRLISPSPRDTRFFIRPNQLLVTPDVSKNSIEITRQPSLEKQLDKNTVKEISSNAKMTIYSSDNLKSMTSEMETYLLTVKIHGVTGIVSGCFNHPEMNIDDRNTTAPPRAVVGISRQGANRVEDHTSFSDDLVLSSFEHECSARGFVIFESQRTTGRSHVAVWSASPAGEMSRSEMQMILPGVQRADGSDPLSRYLPITLDLTIALGPFESNSGRQSLAIPVGAAKLKISNEDIRGEQNHHLDIPVLSLEQSKELSRLASESRSSSSDAFGVPVIELGVCNTRVSCKSDRQKLRQASVSTSKYLSKSMLSSFHSTYGIDGGDDSIIRVEYFVEKVNGETKDVPMTTAPRQMSVTGDHAIEPRAAPSIEFNEAEPSGSDKAMVEDAASLCTVDSKVVESIKLAYQADRENMEDNRRIGYSSPLGFHPITQTDDVVNVHGNLHASNQPESSGGIDSPFFSCGALQSNQSFPIEDQAIGQSIKKPPRSLFEPSTYCVGYAESNEEEDSSFPDASLLPSMDREESLSRNSYSAVSQDASLLPSMHGEESLSRNSYSQHPTDRISVCRSRSKISAMGFRGQANSVQDDVKQLLTETTGAVKDFVADKFGKWAVTQAEELFPSDVTMAERTVPDEDIASVGDATLEAFMNGQLRMRSIDNTKSKYSIDDGIVAMTTTSDSHSAEGSVPDLRNKLTDARSRIDPPISNKKLPQQYPCDHDDFQHIEDKSLASIENDTFTFGSGSMASRDCSSINKTMLTMDTRTETWTKEEEDDTTLNDRSQEESLTGQSVVEAIAEAISNYTSCGSMMMTSNSGNKQKRTNGTTRQVPDTIFDPGEDASELNSLGELTVGTLETLEKKYEMATPTVEASATKARRYHQLHQKHHHQISRQSRAVDGPVSISSRESRYQNQS